MHQEADLHVFSDTSNKAYGTCAYLCCNGQGTLVLGKAKAAPLINVTIPKIELSAVLLAATLTNFIHEVYKGIIIYIRNTHLWCDSQMTLYWLQSRKESFIDVYN